MALSNHQFHTIFIDFDHTLYRHHLHNLLASYKKNFVNSVSEDEWWNFLKLSDAYLTTIRDFTKCDVTVLHMVEQTYNVLKQIKNVENLSDDDKAWANNIVTLMNNSSVWKPIIEEMFKQNVSLLCPSGKLGEWSDFLNKMQPQSRMCVASFSNFPGVIKRFLDDVILSPLQQKPQLHVYGWLPKNSDKNKLLHLFSYFYEHLFIEVKDDTDRELLSSLFQAEKKEQISFIGLSEQLKKLSRPALLSIYKLFSSSILIDDTSENLDGVINFLKFLANELKIKCHTFADTNVLRYENNMPLMEKFEACRANLYRANLYSESLKGQSMFVPASPLPLDSDYLEKTVSPFLKRKAEEYRPLSHSQKIEILAEDLEEKLQQDKRDKGGLSVKEIVSSVVDDAKQDHCAALLSRDHRKNMPSQG